MRVHVSDPVALKGETASGYTRGVRKDTLHKRLAGNGLYIKIMRGVLAKYLLY